MCDLALDWPIQSTRISLGKGYPFPHPSQAYTTVHIVEMRWSCCTRHFLSIHTVKK